MSSPDTQKRGNGDQQKERLLLSAPIVVYGWAPDNSPFHDVASISSLNIRGGVLALAASVQSGQTILLVNSEMRQDIECRVLYVGPEHDGKRKIAFEFVRR